MANEPTLTCSEVVERLAQCVKYPCMHKFDRKEAEKILHSWRERRVQELEEALKLMVEESSPTGVPNRLTRDTFKLATDALNHQNGSSGSSIIGAGK